MEACSRSPMVPLSYLNPFRMWKSRGHGNPFGVPTAPWKRLRLSHFPTSHVYTQIGHLYFAQNRTFLFWVDRAQPKPKCRGGVVPPIFRIIDPGFANMCGDRGAMSWGTARRAPTRGPSHSRAFHDLDLFLGKTIQIANQH